MAMLHIEKRLEKRTEKKAEECIDLFSKLNQDFFSVRKYLWCPVYGRCSHV